MASSDGAILTYIGAAVALLGSLGVALVQRNSGRSEARAHAADMLTEGYSAYTDRMAKDNVRLEIDNTRLRKAIIELIKAEDDHQHKCADHGPIDAAVEIARTIVMDTSFI